MDLNSILYELLKNPDHHGINLFIIGALFILSSYHLSLYIQNKDKTYLYYHFFTGFTLLFLVFDHTDCCQGEDKTTLAYFIVIPLQWIYNTFYILFIKEFTDFKIHKKAWNRILNIIISLSFLSVVLLLAVSIITGNNHILSFSYIYLFLPTITITALISLGMLFQFKSKLKYYALTGSIIFLVLSWFAQYFEIAGNRLTGVLYLAILLENLFFALGLGYKQKQANIEKLKLKNDLIFQLEENQQLKDKLNIQLKNEIIDKAKQLEILVAESEEKNKNQLRLEYEHKLLNLKMTALISQMNPHFLFNALNSIKSFIIKNDKKEAIYYLNKFSTLIRTSLNNSRKHFISLKEELDFIKLYVEIENIRLSKSLDFKIDIKNIKDLSNIIIPPMLLHPFIENSIWHGLSTKLANKKISITIYKKEKQLFIEIDDNGIGREKAAEILKTKMFHKESLGLKLTSERLLVFEKISGKKNHLEFIDKYDAAGNACGTKVILSF